MDVICLINICGRKVGVGGKAERVGGEEGKCFHIPTERQVANFLPCISGTSLLGLISQRGGFESPEADAGSAVSEHCQGHGVSLNTRGPGGTEGPFGKNASSHPRARRALQGLEAAGKHPGGFTLSLAR